LNVFNMPAKSEETRAKILAAALEQFRTEGFDKATMRGIAQKAGVATGLAYYYFASKEALVMAFYDEAALAMQPLLEQVHQREKKLEPRLRALIQTKLDYFAPNRNFLGALMGSAADPANPTSPFSAETAAIREADFTSFHRAVVETGTTLPADLDPHLKKILWLYQMGIILFWIYDRSPDQERTQRLLNRSVSTVALLIKLAALPLVKPARKLAIELIEIVEGNPA
jgi:AcrR family transcriptional regulator